MKISEKIRRKIYLIFATVLIAILTVPFFGATMEERRFNSEEELRRFFPNQYFLNFDLNGMEFKEAMVSSNTQSRWGCSSVRGPLQDDEINWTNYAVIYTYMSDFFDERVKLQKDVNFGDERFKFGYSQIPGNMSSIKVDEIECLLRYGITGASLSFFIADVHYFVRLIHNVEYELVLEFRKYFLSIITPAIIDRQKGGTNL